MLPRMRKLIATGLVAFLTCTAQAEKAVIIGHGNTPCGDWLAKKASKDQIDMANYVGMSQWLLGYLSGINSARMDRNRDAYDLPNYNSIDAYVTKACNDHPLQNLFQVALSLQLAIRRQEQSIGRGKD